MQIDWDFYYNDENNTIDPDDILGKIRISSNEDVIEEDNVYLDNWFESLIDGLFSLKDGKNLASDLISEPDNLNFYKKDTKFCIEFKTSKIYFNEIDIFEKALVMSCKKLVTTIDQNSAKTDKGNIIKLIKFLDYSKT